MKVNFLNREVFSRFLQVVSYYTAVVSAVFIFIDISDGCEIWSLFIYSLTLFVIYIFVWIWANRLCSIEIKIDGTSVRIKAGNLFEQSGLKVITFNEYFDTIVDDKIISKISLNGQFLENHLNVKIEDLDLEIESFNFEEGEMIDCNKDRRIGKKRKYRLGTVFLHEDYILTAMTKFDDSNRAVLTMPEYLEFLIRFWDRVNVVYAQKSVSTPIFGSGITRIKGHKNISDEDLLKIMLWTFRISEMRFKYPAKLTILIHEEKIDQINLLDIQGLKNGV